MKKTAVIALGALVMGMPAAAQTSNTDTESGRASVTITAPEVPLTISHDAGASLNFGSFSVGSAGGTLHLASSDNRREVLIGDVIVDTSSQASADSFTVTGAPSRAVVLRYPDGPTSISSGTNTMTLMNINYIGNGTGTFGAGIGANGVITFRVGGILIVGANQAPGNYSGTYTISATYQ